MVRFLQKISLINMYSPLPIRPKARILLLQSWFFFTKLLSIFPWQSLSQQINLTQLECIDRLCHVVYRKIIDWSVEKPRLFVKWVYFFVSCNKMKEAKIITFEYKFVHCILLQNFSSKTVNIAANPIGSFFDDGESFDHLLWQFRMVADACNNI